MSWFDTNFVSVAIKGALKTIDKALDIKEEETTDNTASLASSSKDEPEGFFSQSARGVKDTSKQSDESPNASDSVASSLWGSFTDSFFDNPKSSISTTKDVSPIFEQPKRSPVPRFPVSEGDLDTDSELADDKIGERFSNAQLVVQCATSPEEPKINLPVTSDQIRWRDKDRSLEPERSQNRNTHSNNRLSVISSESDKRSSDSVEVIGSTSSNVSPDSELPTSFSTSSLSSSAGRRPISASSPDSVDILPDSSVSVEIIESGSSSASLSSPFDGPPDRLERLVPQILKEQTFIDSGEASAVADEDEDVSLADDSYASASESTVTQMTIVESHRTPGSAVEATDSSGNLGQTSPPYPTVLDTSIDTLNSDTSTYGSQGSLPRSGLQLPLTTEFLQSSKSWSSQSQTDQQSLSTKTTTNKMNLSKSRESLNRSFEKKDKILAEASSVESSTSSSRELSSLDDNLGVLTLTDSSGEGTLIESGSEDITPATDAQSQSSSGIVENMLADAMGDETRQIRLGSEQTSGHTSGDELETTTSSDIEIISSPNGDGSSTTSRQSPAKLLHRAPSGPTEVLKYPGKMKGHQREPSEASSGGSEDSHCSEVDRLLKRISDLSELLDARESKLSALSRSHAELQESHLELRSQLENTQQSRLSESRSLNEEFTRRLSALERKFQQAIRDKESLQKQLEQCRSEKASQLSEHVGERDETIRELRSEGEKLSRLQLQQSNLIKKLRVKEKESDNTIKTLREQVESLTGEVDRLKRSLAAKEEVERSQIEAVHQLTARSKKLEVELVLLKEIRDQSVRKAEQAQAALDSANKDLSAARVQAQGLEERIQEETLKVEERARSELEAALTSTQQQKRQLMLLLDKAREKLAEVEAHTGRREAELLERLEAAERRSEGLSQQVSEATRPLLRQLQTLQASTKTQQDAWEHEERLLHEQLGEAQSQIAQLSDTERTVRQEVVSLRSKVSILESKINSSTSLLESAQGKCIELQAELDKTKLELSEAKADQKQREEDFSSQVKSLEHQLSIERAAKEAEKRRTHQLQEQLRERVVERDRERCRESELGRRDSPPVISGHSSPTISCGRESISESVSSIAWPVFSDDAFETSSISGRNFYESMRSGHTTSLLEGLQSQLKMREGELHQLQWELSRREAQRCALTAELSTLSSHSEDLESRLNISTTAQEELTSQLATLRTEYDALLQLYGEKLEESQELRLDLQDVKDMYKAQIDQLLKKDDIAKQEHDQEKSTQEHQQKS